MTLALKKNEAHLWYLHTDEVERCAVEEAYSCLLTPDERDRCDRFRRDEDRLLFLISRILLRNTLSRYACIAPADWWFSTNDHGRPEIATEGYRHMRFSLSHSGPLAMLGITLERNIGVDVEQVKPINELSQVTKIVCSPSELEELEKTKEAHRVGFFYRLWTLKEAYVKARGLGLSLPLQEINIDISADGSARLVTSPDFDPDFGTYQLRHWKLPTGHRAAIAVMGHEIAIRVMGRRCGVRAGEAPGRGVHLSG